MRRRRDPRTAPLPNDVVMVGCRARLVLASYYNGVRYQATPRSLGVESRWCSLDAWRRWARRGRVVCRGVM